jgi:hypothetical protein
MESSALNLRSSVRVARYLGKKGCGDGDRLTHGTGALVRLGLLRPACFPTFLRP